MENKKNSSLLNKIVTIGFCALLVSMTIAAFIYLSVGPDFTKPTVQKPTQPTGNGNVDYEKLLWESDMEDLLNYLEKKGHITQADKIPMSTIGTDNWICNGIDLIWWDVDNLVEGTEEYEYWQQFQTDGFIIFGGTVYAPTLNGPFGIYATGNFPGDADQLYADFANFVYEYYAGAEPEDVSRKVWEYDMDDLLTYLDAEGFIEKDGKQLLSTIGTENWVCNGVDLIWWDVDNLVEGTEEYEYWQQFQSDGFIIYGSMVYAPVFNGPFAICATGNFSGDTDALYEAFANFAQNYTPQ